MSELHVIDVKEDRRLVRKTLMIIILSSPSELQVSLFIPKEWLNKPSVIISMSVIFNITEIILLEYN